MTPQPMSDAEIRRLSDEADIAWGKAVGGPLPYELFARAILAARDAQWQAMLGTRTQAPQPDVPASQGRRQDRAGGVVYRVSRVVP